MNSVPDSELDQATQQHPAAYDPNSNGATEVNCKRIGGLLRTLLFDFEARFGKILGVDHPVFGCLLEHASWILTTREKLTDGRTPYQLARGSRGLLSSVFDFELLQRRLQQTIDVLCQRSKLERLQVASHGCFAGSPGIGTLPLFQPLWIFQGFARSASRRAASRQ